ncbi:MAG: endonuclease/exonuclease/phosphatase family protein [Bacillota bacterium]
MRERLRPWADLTAVALLFWMGIHTIRTYLAMGGWVMGSGLTEFQLGVLLLSIWGTGLLGYPASRLLGGRVPAVRLALLFGALYVLYRAVPGAYTTPIFGCLSVTAWLWLLPAALRALGGAILPGLLLGVGGQVALQTALHGMDLVMLIGPGPALLALGLAALLVLSLRWGSAGDEAAGESGAPGWGLIAWGPYLALQMTLAANLGWLQWLGGLSLQGAAAFVLAGLALGAVMAGLRLPFLLRLPAGLIATGLLLEPGWLEGSGIWLLLPVQALLPLTLAPAFAPRPGARPERTYLWLGLGSLLAIGLILFFYQQLEGKHLWPLMAALAALPGLALGPRREPAAGAGGGARRALALLLGVGLVALPLSLIPRSAERPATGPAPAELTVMTYNIHQLFGAGGVPGPEAVARVIEAANPDLIGLQETGRGWNFVGAADMLSWLRWRFPGYHLRYGRTEGNLVGNILLSRYPILEGDWELYPMKRSRLQRGLVWVRIPTVQGDLLFVNTHLSAWRQEEEERIIQANHLIRFWDGRPRFILLGDLNARPGTEPLRILEEGGLVDLSKPLGLSEAPTFPARRPRIRLDHIFGSREIEPLRMEIPQTLASDHLPVVMRIRLRPR